MYHDKDAARGVEGVHVADGGDPASSQPRCGRMPPVTGAGKPRKSSRSNSPTCWRGWPRSPTWSTSISRRPCNGNMARAAQLRPAGLHLPRRGEAMTSGGSRTSGTSGTSWPSWLIARAAVVALAGVLVEARAAGEPRLGIAGTCHGFVDADRGVRIRCRRLHAAGGRRGSRRPVRGFTRRSRNVPRFHVRFGRPAGRRASSPPNRMDGSRPTGCPRRLSCLRAKSCCSSSVNFLTAERAARPPGPGGRVTAPRDHRRRPGA